MTEPVAAFAFSNHGESMMTITADGRFIVRGKEVETTQEIRDVFVEFCRLWNAEHEARMATYLKLES